MHHKTLITIALDRSGSMEKVKDATIEAFNGFIQNQKEVQGDAHFSLFQFDSQGIDPLYEGVPGSTVTLLDTDNYQPRASTPLLDAIGIVANRARDYSLGHDYNNHALVIQTDGYENASKEWDLDAVKALLAQLESDNWQIIFLGAGIDAFAEMKQVFGTRTAQSYSYTKDPQSTQTMGAVVSAAVGAYRMSGQTRSMDARIKGEEIEWATDVDPDDVPTSKPWEGRGKS